MNRRIILKSPQAKRDLVNGYTYIKEYNAEAAERFLKSAEVTFAMLGSMPDIGAPYKTVRYRNLRRSFVVEFRKYQIFYLSIDKGIKIIRVLHSARDIRKIMGYAA